MALRRAATCYRRLCLERRHSSTRRGWIPWYLFSAVFLFCAGYAAAQPARAHRRDFRRLSKRPGMIILSRDGFSDADGAASWMSWPVSSTYQHSEDMTNAGGLPIWPARLMLPIGFCC
jgi:TRAP-type mannitol/chloroaromatic compound transport system permease small subunit